MDYMERGILLIIADFLSIITISLCLVAKVPQIKTIQDTKSSHGLSILALLLEVSSYTVMASYNYCNGYAIMSYMEYPILLCQEYVLIYLVFKYKNLLTIKSFIGTLIYVSVTIGFLGNFIPLWMLKTLVPLCTPIGATSKIMQLYEIIRTKDSSSVSAVSWFLSAFTNLTRIYTIMVDSADLILLSNFTISFFLSTSVFLATLFYKKPKIE